MHRKLLLFALFLITVIVCCFATPAPSASKKRGNRRLSRLLSCLGPMNSREEEDEDEEPASSSTTTAPAETTENSTINPEDLIENFGDIRKTVYYVDGSDMEKAPERVRKKLEKARRTSDTRLEYMGKLGEILHRKSLPGHFYVIEVQPPPPATENSTAVPRRLPRPRCYVID